MPFIEEILKHKSLSIVGLEKNTGKTECLNYVLSRLKNKNSKIALTSIGVDGESVDIVKNTHKPEIEIFEDVVFMTSEMHYKQKRITSEILDISKKQTSLGRLITARSVSNGKVIFSGPSDTVWLKACIDGMSKFNIDTTIVDGALSRMSQASPAVTQSMILTTGAAVSPNIKQLVKKTKFIYELIQIPKFENTISDQMLALNNGVYAIDSNNNLHDLEISSVFLIDKHKDKLFEKGNNLFFSGAISDKLLDLLKTQKDISETTIIVKDFTKLFVTPEKYYSFLNKGGKIFVLLNTKLIAVCVNPTSPEGFILDSKTLRETLSQELNIPVYDVKSFDL